MRAALLPFAFGALLMLTAADPTPADGQEKDPALKAPYTEFVTFEGTDANGKAFKIERLPAFKNSPTAPSWKVPYGKVAPAATFPYVNSKITDKAGKAYRIKETKIGGPYLYCRIDEPDPK